jgi:hypothetical protein
MIYSGDETDVKTFIDEHAPDIIEPPKGGCGSSILPCVKVNGRPVIIKDIAIKVV